jgi:hypothetical protein
MDNFLYNPEEIDFEQVASHDEVLAFDWHSLEKLQEKITESIEDGYQRMFTCYRSGIKRMDDIVEENIHNAATQVKTVGGKQDLVSMKVIKSKKRMRVGSDHTTEQAASGSTQARELHDDMEIGENNEYSQLLSPETGMSSETSNLRKRPTHRPTATEEEILKNIKTLLYYLRRSSMS